MAVFEALDFEASDFEASDLEASDLKTHDCESCDEKEASAWQHMIVKPSMRSLRCEGFLNSRRPSANLYLMDDRGFLNSRNPRKPLS